MTRAWLAAAGSLALLGVLSAPVHAFAPRAVELPPPELSFTVAPLPLGVTRPSFEPPAPPRPPAPMIDLTTPPLPRFQSVVPKPLPAVRDPGGTACTFAFGRASSLADCGVHRALGGDLRGAREALEDSLTREPRGPAAGAAYVWLGEVAFREVRYDEAERAYRTALALPPPADLVPHAALGMAWVALRRGSLSEAQRALGHALAGTPPPAVAVVARFLDGVSRVLAGRAAEAQGLWDAVAAASPAYALAEELLFWRGVGLAALGQWDPALQALDRFLAGAAGTHPLRADAIVQSGWVALARRMPDDAVRRFLWAQSSTPRSELLPQLRAGLVRAYLALGDPARARDAARALRAESARDPLLPSVLVLLADDASRRNVPAETVDAYRQLLALQPDPALAEYATYRLAETVERLGGAAEAERHYRTLRDTGRVEAVAQRAGYRLGLVLLRAQRPVEARAEGEGLLRAGALAELRESALLLTAEAAARGGDANRAVTLFRLAVRDYPASPQAGVMRLLLGWALSADGEPLSALREWQQAGQATDRDVSILAYLAIADVGLQQGQEADSLTALRELSGLAPAHPLADTLALDRGILLVRAQEYGPAVQVLEPLVPRLSDPPRQALLRRALALARYHLGQYDMAEREFSWAAYWAPSEPSNALGVGLAALAQNRLTEADRALGTARLAAAPAVATPASYASILVAERRRDPVLFRDRATQFVDRYPRHPYASLVLYALLRRAAERGDLDQAESWLSRLVREQPASDYVRDGLMVVADGAAPRRPALARQAYTQLLARVKEPDVRTEAWLGLADAAMALRDGAEAQRALDGFLSEAPVDDARAPRALALLVRAHEMQGQRERTLAATERFLSRYPNDPLAPGIQLTRGQLLLIAQQWSAAQQALEAARDAGEPLVAASAQFYLGEVHRARGDHEAAIEAYLGATYLYPDTSPWAVRGLQGAIQSYLARQMPREASILLRKLIARPGLEPDLAQWARRALAQLGPVTGEDPSQALKKGAVR